MKHITQVRAMDKKKNGEVLVFLLGCFSIGLIAGSFTKNKFKKHIANNQPSIAHYINRLSEFDLSSDKVGSEFFFDLMSSGFSAQLAFDIVQKECIEMGEKFND